MKKVVLIGDSIRMSYQPLVVKKLQGRAEVWGPEQNCRHSLWALDHFQEWVFAQRPDVLHFNFGIHDAVIMDDGEFQIIIEQYRLCLRRFIKLAGDLRIQMIWGTTTPRYKGQDGCLPQDWTKMTEIDDYNAAALKIVSEHKIAVNDLHQVILDNDYIKCLQTDGCHMSDFGQEVLAEGVVEAVSPLL